MNPILISIIIPLFNSEKYLSETLDSVRKQTYTNWECLIIDDGSTDSSSQIALNYCNNDSRFKYFFKKNEGPSAARNFGVQRAEGKFIQFLDADDVLLPARLEIMTRESEKVNKGVILYSGLLLGDTTDIYKTSQMNLPANIGRDISFKEMYSGFGIEFLFIPACLFFPKDVISNIKWNEKLIQAEDWDFYLSILSNGFLFHYISQPLIIYRDTPNSLSKNTKSTIKASYAILLKWASKHNSLQFIKRCAKLYNRNLFYFFNKQIDCIVKPTFTFKNHPFIWQIFIFLIYPYRLYYFQLEILRILLKKTRKLLRLT